MPGLVDREEIAIFVVKCPVQEKPGERRALLDLGLLLLVQLQAFPWLWRKS